MRDRWTGYLYEALWHDGWADSVVYLLAKSLRNVSYRCQRLKSQDYVPSTNYFRPCRFYLAPWSWRHLVVVGVRIRVCRDTRSVAGVAGGSRDHGRGRAAAPARR